MQSGLPVHERHNQIFEEIYKVQNNGSYYEIFGLNFYVLGSEGNRHNVINEIIALMQERGWEIQWLEVEKPKIHNDKVFSYVNSYYQPEVIKKD